MKKCFVLSLHRSGTKSLSAFLNEIGLRTVHFPSKHNGNDLQSLVRGRETDFPFVLETIRPVIESCDAVSDVPIPALYSELDRAYPESRFLLLKREPADWIRSVRKTASGRKFRPFERVQYWRYFKDRPGSIDHLTDADLAGMYERHSGEVTGHFGDRLGVFNLLDPDCGPKAASYLGIETSLRLRNVPENMSEASPKQGFLRRLLNQAPKRPQ